MAGGLVTHAHKGVLRHLRDVVAHEAIHGADPVGQCAAHAGDAHRDDKKRKRKSGKHSQTQPPHAPLSRQVSTSDATNTGTGTGSADPIEEWVESGGQGVPAPGPRSGLFGGKVRAVDADGRFVFPPAPEPPTIFRTLPNGQRPLEGDEFVCFQCARRGHFSASCNLWHPPATEGTKATGTDTTRDPTRSGLSLCGDLHITDSPPPPDDQPRSPSSDAPPQKHDSLRHVLLSCTDHGGDHANLAWLANTRKKWCHPVFKIPTIMGTTRLESSSGREDITTSEAQPVDNSSGARPAARRADPIRSDNDRHGIDGTVGGYSRPRRPDQGQRSLLSGVIPAVGILTFGNACAITSSADFSSTPIQEEDPASTNSPPDDAELEEDATQPISRFTARRLGRGHRVRNRQKRLFLERLRACEAHPHLADYLRRLGMPGPAAHPRVGTFFPTLIATRPSDVGDFHPRRRIHRSCSPP